ncbi:MAG: hypothetical protein J5648_03375 [Lachnospiraceae bacterium]|nr:hypothetical protein [Lachnospiraceae bacterium]
MISPRGKWIALLLTSLLLLLLVFAEAASGGKKAASGPGADEVREALSKDGRIPALSSVGGVANGMPDDSMKLFAEGYFGTTVPEYVSFPDFESARKALDCGKVSAIWAADVTAEYLEQSGEYVSFAPAETPGGGEERFSFAFAFAPESEALRSNADSFLTALKALGGLERGLIGETWTFPKEMLSERAETSPKKAGRNFYIGVTGAVPPLAVYEGGTAHGAAAEIAGALAESLGYRPVFVNLQEETAYVSLMAGRVDMLCVGATSENHSLTTPKYLTSTGYFGVKEYRLLMRKEGRKVSGWMNVIKDNLISGGAYRQIFSAVITTAVLMLLACVIASLFWLALKALSESPKTVLQKTAAGLAYIFRSIPVPLLLLLLGSVVLAGVHIPLLIPAALGIGLNGAGLLYEASASGKDAEATAETTENDADLDDTGPNAYGFRQRLRFLASRPARRTAVTMLQWTTVSGCIGVRDLAEVFQTIGNRTMYPLFAIACCIVFYLLAVIILELLPYAERKTA